MKAEKLEPASPFPREFDASEAEWKAILSAHGFREPDAAFRMLREFAEGPGYVHVSPHTTELARQLISKILAMCPQSGKSEIRPAATTRQRGENPKPEILSDPDRVLTRLDNFITAYGARSSLFEMWNSHPAMFELLLLLFDRSEFLAEMAIRTPDLIDDLVVSERLRQRKTTEEILRDLRHGRADADQFLWLRRYHGAELMRIGLRDILGLADFDQNLSELSALADACLQYALQIVLRENRLKQPPFVIVGLGKLGGREINYGSDLDLVFVTDAKAKDLPKLQKLAVRVLDLMSRRTEQGIVFPTDARLRPDGEKGLLVNTLAAYEEYYRQRAQLWEIQSLTRARPVAGDWKLGERFQKLAMELTDFGSKQKAESRKPKSPMPLRVGCYTEDWKQKIHAMRMRIEKERTPAGQDELAIKTGRGGLMDAEFMAQVLCLEHGWPEPHTLRALERARNSVGVQPSGCTGTGSTLKRELQHCGARLTPADWDKLIENYKHLRGLEGILRRWSYEGETVLPADPAAFYRVAVRCGFATAEEFRAALAGWRLAIREVYETFFLTSFPDSAALRKGTPPRRSRR